MPKIHLVRRQLTGSLHQAAIFVLCVVLSLVTLVSLSGFSRSVHSSFLKDARQLHAADIIIHAHSPLSQPLLLELSALEKQRKIVSARTYEFYSIVRTTKGDASLLSSLKVVDPGYPFYGSVQLSSARPFGDVMTPGSIVVEQALLDRLHLGIGDRVRIGKAAFTIRDTVLLEPDQPVNFFSLGPRVFIPGHDLAALELVGQGSRVDYTLLVKVIDQKDLDRVALRLKAVSLSGFERVETFRTAESGVKRFFDNFLFFLNLIGIFTLLLAGIGIQSSLTAFLAEQERTIAIMKAVGAGSPFIIRNYFALVFVLGSIGTAIGLGASFLLERLLPGLFQGLLPASIELTISGAAVAEGVVLGCVVVVLKSLGETVRRVLRGGGHVMAGTDSPIIPFGLGLQVEIQNYVEEAGLTPREALMTATSGFAKIVGLEKELGTIAPGKLADLIAVEGNPLTNINDAKRVQVVVKDGEVYTQAQLRAGAVRPRKTR